MGATEGVDGIELRTGPKVAEIEQEESFKEKVRRVLELPESARYFNSLGLYSPPLAA